ncbi:MAG: aminotransferase class IV [Actinomycetota bacterium]|nr:aminotransferase class IV [Actinomycetota bacterium]
MTTQTGPVWLDGRLLPAAEAAIATTDRGLTVGDGVFETMLVIDGRAFALRRHLERLAASADALGITTPAPGELRTAVEELLTATGPAAGRVRLTATAGPGSVGTARHGGVPTVLVTATDRPTYPATSTVAVVRWTRNERDATAGVKTTSYAGNVRALAAAHGAGADEALFANTSGALCEGTGTNVFVVRDGRLCTPPLSSGCLPGVTRALVLELTDAVEADLAPDDLRRADEAFLTSTTRGVHPIAAVDGSSLVEAPGPITKAAAEAYAELQARDLDP